MPKRKFKKVAFELNPEAPVFIIGVVSELVSIPIWTLRKLDELGVVKPKRSAGKTRCYSHEQVEQLYYIRYLIQDEGVNISGLKIILELRKERENEDV